MSTKFYKVRKHADFVKFCAHVLCSKKKIVLTICAHAEHKIDFVLIIVSTKSNDSLNHGSGAAIKNSTIYIFSRPRANT